MSHAGYLREQWTDDPSKLISLVRRVVALGVASGQLTPEALLLRIDHLELDELVAPDQAMVRFALRLAVRPGSTTQSQVVSLAELGWSDDLIHDAVQVVACFGYMNRLADGLGVVIEASKRPLAVDLFGEQRTREHTEWGGRDIRAR